MKKIRIVIQNLKFGGAEKTLIDFLKNYDRNSYSVELVLHTKEGQLLDEVPEDVSIRNIVPLEKGFFSKVARSSFFKALKYFPLLAKMIIQRRLGRADLTVAYLEGIATEISSVLDGPKIAWVHTDLSSNPWTDIFFRNMDAQKKAYEQFQKIIFVSRGGEVSFKRRFGSDFLWPTAILPNPIDTERIRKQANILNSEFTEWKEKTKGTIRLITVGRMDPIKRVDLLIKGFLQARKNDFLLSLTIIGDGRELNNLKSQFGQTEGLYFLGFQKNPTPYVKNSQMFISTSLVESYPTSIIESLILGTPVIATENVGSKEILNGLSDVMIPSKVTEADLAMKITESLKSLSQRQQAIEPLVKRFELEQVLHKYYEVFDEAMKDG
ncbi:glycosyltransferase [Furfurilactobacillus curtus]|uniref:Glycosyltransferase n=1 Tax=Furfurilactobacillus curtus TaxID=1746200 RepID=A0ABQ5JSG2_9LACO